jgi:hypothetical protein
MAGRPTAIWSQLDCKTAVGIQRVGDLAGDIDRRCLLKAVVKHAWQRRVKGCQADGLVGTSQYASNPYEEVPLAWVGFMQVGHIFPAMTGMPIRRDTRPTAKSELGTIKYVSNGYAERTLAQSALRYVGGTGLAS